MAKELYLYDMFYVHLPFHKTLRFHTAHAVKEASFSTENSVNCIALVVDCHVNRWMYIARQTNPHLQSYEGG